MNPAWMDFNKFKGLWRTYYKITGAKENWFMMPYIWYMMPYSSKTSYPLSHSVSHEVSHIPGGKSFHFTKEEN